MERDPADVRLVWPGTSDTGQAPGPQRLAALDWRGRRALLLEERPARAAAVRGQGDVWITVCPDPPWLNGWRLKVLAAMALSLTALVTVALLLAGYLTRPFRDLANALEHGWPVLPPSGPRELREAAAALAQSRARLEDEVAERRRVLTAIAHDLRTPLTALRLRVVGVEDCRRVRMIADIERMARMVDEILAFGRAELAPRETLSPSCVGLAMRWPRR